jgi:hypothetical protein
MLAEAPIAEQVRERTVTLTDAELWFCKSMGGMRAVMARRVGVLDRRMGPQDPLAADEDGMIAEYAFCKMMNVFYDAVPDPRKGSADCVIDGYAIDVKATRRANGRLLVTLRENRDVNIYVLAIIEGNTVRFPGYALKSEICRDENKINLGHGEGYGLRQDQLRRFKPVSDGASL